MNEVSIPNEAARARSGPLLRTGSILEVKDLSVIFHGHQILKDINFFISRGDVLAIVGPNGAGKSVLLRALLNLIPYSGEVAWEKNLKVSYIPQRFAVDRDFPLTVKEFLNFKEKKTEKISAALKSVGLDDSHRHFMNTTLGVLSGGQLQRLLIAWSIIDEPDVILFDEPTTGIDVGGEETIYNLIKKLRDEKGITVILVSHELNIVYKYANNVLCLNKQMICFGIPHEVLDPAALAKLYGGEAGFYNHDHHEH